uniref:Uncharacterized protein n=1 Tax=Lepeophtheirus salmonis TaxID=72036 RepID=A0A0K2TBD1_LEPSM
MLVFLFRTPYSTRDDVMNIHPRKTTRLHKRVKWTPLFGKGIPG